MRCAPVLNAPRQPDFFNARSKTLMPSWSGSLHLAKYECTVRHLGKSLGRNLHWQPVRSRYSTAQNTSCRSTAWGLVRRRTLQQQEVDLFKLLAADVAGVCLSHCTTFGEKGTIVNMLLHATRCLRGHVTGLNWYRSVGFLVLSYWQHCCEQRAARALPMRNDCHSKAVMPTPYSGHESAGQRSPSPIAGPAASTTPLTDRSFRVFHLAGIAELWRGAGNCSA